MLPLGLDQSVRPLVESPVVVGPNEGNSSAPDDTFDSHLGRPSDTQIVRAASSENGTRDEQSDDEPDREDVATVAATNSPVQPEAHAPPEARENPESETEASDPDTIMSVENKSEDSSLGDSHEKLLELKAKVANAITKSKADNQVIEGQADDSGQDSVSIEDATRLPLTESPSEIVASESTDVEPKTVEVTKVVAPNEPFQASLVGDATMLSESLPVTIGNETEEGSAPKSINSAPSKSESRKSKINHAELSPASNVEPAPALPTLSPALAEFGKPLQEASNSPGIDRRDSAAINARATSVDRDPGAATNSAAHRLVQHLSGGSEERALKAGVLAGSDQTRFVDRVARAFRAAENRQGVVKLRLHPPELGSLRIELRMQNGALTARLEAETAMTQSLLIEHVQALRDRLSEQGVRVERFDVDLADRRSMDQSSNFQDRSQREKEPANHTQRDQQLATPTNTRAVPLSSSPTSPGKINVIV